MSDVTLKHIAETLNISVSTVSKALKDYYDVSPKTKKRVKELAKELNYTPNSLAVNFRTKETKTIGLIIPEIVHHFFSSVINGITAEAEKENYLVIIVHSNESLELEKKQLQLLMSKRVDGILMALSNSTVRFEHVKNALDKGTSIVLFDKIGKGLNCSKVLIDDRKAAYQATEYLIKTGCKKIAHIRGPLIPLNSIDRFLGYKKALEDYNLEYDSSLIYTCDDVTFDEGYNFAERMINEHPDIDGVFVITDLVATGVITKFNELGVKIPEQVSIVGFSNWFMSRAITPSLTTIDQPGFGIGAMAFKQLIKEIKCIKEDIPFEFETINLPTSLVVRRSTK